MARELYCWRCDMVVPMLTEQEWALMEPVLVRQIEDLQAYRQAHQVSLAETMTEGFGESACRVYRELTGFRETNPDAVWHHRISMYGLPCQACGKALRTPRAAFCAACGERV